MRNLTSETASCHSKRENIALICEQNENRVHSRVPIMQSLRGRDGMHKADAWKGFVVLFGEIFQETESESGESEWKCRNLEM